MKKYNGGYKTSSGFETLNFNKMEIKEAISKITTELKNDTGYRESWKANIAMSYKDCEHWYKQKTGKKRLNKEDVHIIANDAAEHFLKLLCDEYRASGDM